MDKRRGPFTVEEVLAEKARRLREDPDFRAKMEQQEAERAEKHRRYLEAEGPVLDTLAAAGIEIRSSFDGRPTLYGEYATPDAERAAVPILLDLMKTDLPDDVLFALGIAIADKAARPHWDQMKALLLETDREEVRDRLAATMSGCAVRQHYDDLLQLVGEPRLGTKRIYFLRTIARIGNRMTPGAGRAVIERLATDPELAREAAAILAGRGVND